MPIVHCPCGASVRLPDEASQRSFRCPKCKAVFAVTADSQVIVAHAVSSAGATTICPICQSAITSGDAALTCPTCQQAHHQECWLEIGGCSTYGCAQAPVTSKEAAAGQPLSAWGDTKVCPVCGEQIKSIALKCRYCRTEFNSADPLTMRDLRRRDAKAEAQKTLRITACVMFGLSLLLGCLAPIMAVANLVWLLPRRREIAAAGPIYLVLAYSATGLSILYSILMAIAIALEQ